MNRAALMLIIITILSKIIGFGKEIVLSFQYGTSYVTDAYLISQAVPGFVLTFLGAAITTTYMPLFSEIESIDGAIESQKFSNKVINLLILIAILIILSVLVLTEPIVKIFASGFTGETLALSIFLTRIAIFSILFFGIVYVLNGFLQLKGNFIAPALSGIPLNITLMISIYVSSIYGYHLLAYGKIVAVITQLLMLVFFAKKLGYKYRLEVELNDRRIFNMIYLAIPVVFGTSVNEINRLIDRTIASNIAVGGIAALNYAERINIFIQSIFIMSIATVLYANITKFAAKGENKELLLALKESIIGTFIFTVPATVGVVLFANPIVSLLFGRGKFDEESIIITSTALSYYALGIVAIGIREIMVRVFYSLKDTKKPVINAMLGMIMNLLLNIILSKYIGIGGLALASSLSAIFIAILMTLTIRKKLGSIGLKQISFTFLKILISSLIMGIIAEICYRNLTIHFSNHSSLFFSIILGGTTYFLIIYFMKIDDVDVMVRAIKEKLKNYFTNKSKRQS